MNCPLCSPPQAETIVWADETCRVILADEAGYPAFCRVIWHAHVAEMTDLPPGDQAHLFQVVLATEAALRELMQPDKINLATLGNMVPHLHWHVIPRFRDDRHFPAPVWATATREGISHPAPSQTALATALINQLSKLRSGAPSATGAIL